MSSMMVGAPKDAGLPSAGYLAACDELRVGLYEFTNQLPDTERYNLTSQMRKAVTSVCLNIAEGAGCTTNGEFARFLGYAYRSLKEVATCLELSQRLFPALPADSIASLIEEANQTSRMTYALIQRLGGRGGE
jgi:four helix bundle protein